MGKRLRTLRTVLPISAAVLLFFFLAACPTPIDENLVTLSEDELAPEITIQSPEDSSTYKSTITVTGEVVDSSVASGDKKGAVKSLSYKVQDHSQLAGDVSFAADGAFSFSFATTELNGRETILINAVDWNDNEAVRELVLYEDESGPYINIVDPGNNTPVSDQVTVTAAVGNSSEEPALLSEVASITWEVIDPGFLAETILFDSNLKDGTTTQIPQNVTFDTSIPASTDPYNETTYSFYTYLLSGQKWIKVTAVDWQGHSSQSVIALIINAAGPYLAVTGPVDNDKYHGTVNVTGVVQNSSTNTGLEGVDYLQCDILGYSGIWVRIDFDNVTPANPPTITSSSGSGTFDQLNNTFDVLLNTSGISDSFLRINVRAVGTGGKISDDSIDLVEDTSGPQLNIATPAANDDYGTSLTLAGNVKSYSGAPDASEVSALEYTINGSTVDILSYLDAASGNFSGISVNTASCSGPKTLTVSAEDQNGHISSVDVALDDGLPPSLSISQPTTGYQASTTVTGTVLDYSGAASAAAVDSVSYSIGALSGTLSFSSSTGAISDSIDCSSLTGTQTLTIDAVDDYGNSLAVPVSISLTDGIKPEFDSASITTVSGTANDTINVVFSEDVNETDAETAGNYHIELNGDNDTIDFGAAVLTYTSATKTVEIRLADGDQPDTDSGSTVRFDTGTAYDIEVSGIRDLNGNTMDGTQTRTVTASGDAAVPTVSSAVQNTTVDGTGKTVDITFSEAVDASEAGTGANYSVSGTGAPSLSSLTVESATLIRLVFDAAVTPGTHTLSITAGSIHDLAGNAIGDSGDITIE